MALGLLRRAVLDVRAAASVMDHVKPLFRGGSAWPAR